MISCGILVKNSFDIIWSLNDMHFENKFQNSYFALSIEARSIEKWGKKEALMEPQKQMAEMFSSKAEKVRELT